MKKNIIKDKSFQFAVRIVGICRRLQESQREYVMSRQLLRSSTAIGALVRESEHAESKSDFIHKLSIALKEANESEYWFLLLKETKYLNTDEQLSLQNDLSELLRILISIIKSSKTNK